MSWQLAFSLVALPVAPLWLLMIFLPTWRWTERIIRQPWSFAPLAVVYAVMVIPRLGELAPELANPQLESIAALLATPAGATIAWVHFLVFDAFVGRWIYLDSRERKVHPLIMGPVLALVIMFGPLGFLVYLLVRLGARPSTGQAAT
jgi:hypothetical protein